MCISSRQYPAAIYGIATYEVGNAELKRHYHNTIVMSNYLRPLHGAFRTVDWVKIREELNDLAFIKLL